MRGSSSVPPIEPDKWPTHMAFPSDRQICVCDHFSKLTLLGTLRLNTFACPNVLPRSRTIMKGWAHPSFSAWTADCRVLFDRCWTPRNCSSRHVNACLDRFESVC